MLIADLMRWRLRKRPLSEKQKKRPPHPTWSVGWKGHKSKDLDCNMTTQDQSNNSFGNEKLAAFNGVVVGIAKTIGTLTGSLSEFGQLVPLLEIAVTIGVFWRYGGHLEVIMGVFFAQLVALFLVNHYADVAMTTVGQWAIYASILVGALNTGFAISYGLNGGGGLNGFMADFVGMTASISVVLSYVAKLGTHEAVARRTALKARGDAALAEIKRKASHEAALNANRDAMQLARLNLQRTATDDLTSDPRMEGIQRRAMAGTFVNEILASFQIDSRSKLGKELIGEAAKIAGVDDEEPTPPAPRPTANEPFLATNGHGKNGR